MFFLKNKLIPIAEFFPKGFVDIHSHLLPGIDDGAKDLEMSIELMTRMASFGMHHFVTTPHVLGDLYPNTPEIIRSKLTEVRQELSKRGLNHLSIHAAAEYMLDEQFAEILSKGNLLTLRDHFILVEMSYFSPPLNLYELLFEIQLKGYKPVLAHPERYFTFHNNMNAFYKLKKAGCLFQLNLLSLTPHYGKPVEKTAVDLLKAGLYDFVGTDTHHQNHLNLLEKVATKGNVKLLGNLMERNVGFGVVSG